MPDRRSSCAAWGQKSNTCAWKKQVKAWVPGPSYLQGCNEALLQQYLAKYGPIAVSVYVGMEFQAYESGILTFSEYSASTPSQCKTNHAVQLVGYGTEGFVDYW